MPPTGIGIPPLHDWKLVLFLMIIGVLIGSVAVWCYDLRTASKEEKADKWAALLKHFGMGIAAVALVPVFLQMISSTLLTQTETSVESRFVFAGFCVAASFAARKFLAVIPEKILQTVENLKADERKNAERTEILAEVVANKTAKEPKPPSDQIVKSELEQNLGYDFNGALVIRAFFNPKYPRSRTTSGIAFESGLDFPQTLKWLNLMQEKGHVTRFPNERPGKDSWRLTDQGIKKFEPFRDELRKLSMEDTDWE